MVSSFTIVVIVELFHAARREKYQAVVLVRRGRPARQGRQAEQKGIAERGVRRRRGGRGRPKRRGVFAAKVQRHRWPGAPYLPFVDNKFHARLLAMTRLGVPPIEIETGRWQGLARDQRRCSLGCDHVGDTEHFLYGCTQ